MGDDNQYDRCFLTLFTIIFLPKLKKCVSLQTKSYKPV